MGANQVNRIAARASVVADGVAGIIRDGGLGWGRFNSGHHQGNPGFTVRANLHLQTSSQISQTLSDAKNPGTVGSEQGRIGGPVIFDGNSHMRISAVDQNRDVAWLSVRY